MQTNAFSKLGANALASFALLYATIPPAVAAEPNWPQFRGPNRDDISADKGLLTEWPKDGPPLVWKATGIGGGIDRLRGEGGETLHGPGSWQFCARQRGGCAPVEDG